jgi:hypothetical protein
MNPFYQLSIVEDAFYNLTDSKREIVSISPKEIEPKEIVAVKPTIYSSPILDTKPTVETRPLAIDPILDKPITDPIIETRPAVAIGDTSAPIKDGTTINIFNPDGQTSTTSLSDIVSVDTATGEVETGNTIGGGGGGGMMGGGEDSDKQGQVPIVKTWIPLLVIAVGIGVIILKPIK